MHLPVDPKAGALFNATVIFRWGEGSRISFWHEPRHHGAALEHVFLILSSICRRRRLTVPRALRDSAWIRHLKQQSCPRALREFCDLWITMHEVNLTELPGSVSLKWTSNGVYSADSAYKIQFEGCQRFILNALIWKSVAMLRCKVFSWLVIPGRRFTADNLAKRSWPHKPTCTLCSCPVEGIYIYLI